MQMKISHWIGREFVALSSEGKPGLTASEEAKEIFARFGEELQSLDLSLENTVRTRLWAKDRESRDLGSKERIKILSGKARSASSSYIAPDHFDSDAHVALDLLAMRPRQQGIQKFLKEYDPPATPLRYLTCDTIVFLSGVSSGLIDLDDQVADILSLISDSLADAGTFWDRAVKVSFFLHRSQKLETLKGLFKKVVQAEIPHTEYVFVDGYSSEGKLIEIEVTASLTKGL